ncbi:D-hexose-6-phosphate mutarotase [Alteromonas sp. a30]|uniref:D-hexose-6-phosphate mutarotase n=1 Tax=Alteromonas sp. a30 TaxID=2730917 RepID=UPI00227EF5FD|nr:D-hexose-6-phosphate mutarotase [Alteromonas sp. a30]MCY7294035.1 D-hexose-6-phosphate mutarotase [Alteromonas sp. a30]
MQLPASVTIEKQNDNTIFVIDNELASAKISLFGAQVFSFIPKEDDIERLWLSPLTKVDATETIRGGTPVCWPWFASQYPNNDTSLPMHGFARSQKWELISAKDVDSHTLLIFNCPTTSGKGFPHQAELQLEVLVGAQLRMTLITKNTGNEAFEFTGALHTYFAVDDINRIEIIGVDGEYKDKNRDMAWFNAPETYRIQGPNDCIHFSQNARLLIDQSTGNAISVNAAGHDSIVIWNPWKGAKDIANIPDDGYLRFLCIESAVTKGITLQPKNSHSLVQNIG